MPPAHDPLDPDDEQKVFEILSMGQERHAALQRTRAYMKFIMKLENGCYNAETTQDQGTPGDNANPGESTPGSGS